VNCEKVGLAFGGGVGNQRVIVELLGLPQYGAATSIESSKASLWMMLIGALSKLAPFCKLCAGGDFNLVG